MKNQALIQFGPIVHQIYLKQKDLPSGSEKQKKVFNDLINDFCISYYDIKLIKNEKEESTNLEDSLMNKLDEYSFM